MDINSDEYAVTGLPDSVALRLEGSNSLVLSTTGNGTYRVKTPNLTELGEGKHTITLEVSKDRSISLNDNRVFIELFIFIEFYY